VQLKFIGKYTKFTNLDGDFGGDGFGSFNALPNSTFDADAPGSIRLGSRMNDGSQGGGGLPNSSFDDEPPF
jgi:replicative DNA helicase